MGTQTHADAVFFLIKAITTTVGARDKGYPTDNDGNERSLKAKEAARDYDHVPIELPADVLLAAHPLASLWSFVQ